MPAGAFSAAALAYAVVVATFPDERMYLVTHGVEVPGFNTLDVRGEDLIDVAKLKLIVEKNESSLGEPRWVASLSLAGRDLTGANLVGADVRHVDISGAILNRARLTLAWATNARAKLQGASLEAAQLQGASLNGAQLQGASLFGAHLEGASLDGAHLQGASLGHRAAPGRIARRRAVA